MYETTPSAPLAPYRLPSPFLDLTVALACKSAILPLSTRMHKCKRAFSLTFRVSICITRTCTRVARIDPPVLHAYVHLSHACISRRTRRTRLMKRSCSATSDRSN
mmetsp:Transcript_14112/g.28418  ORF Transcript_14112/g.28418 Transcript_14112/m.28418 type:complete len:105 (+) Transcript_14112:94-408(+)